MMKHYSLISEKSSIHPNMFKPVRSFYKLDQILFSQLIPVQLSHLPFKLNSNDCITLFRD